MESPVPPSAVTILQRRVEDDADTAVIAQRFGSIWNAIEAQLFSVVGHRGIAALFQRSLSVAGRDFPWLAGLYGGLRAPVDLAAFQEAVLWQTRANAQAGCNAFLQVFNELLGSVVGPALAARLLGADEDKKSSGPAAQD